MIPLWSIVTLSTELVVTMFVYSIIVSAFRTGVFRKKTALAVLGYELLFNITYMASRAFRASANATILTPYQTILAIFHGTFSLVMFIALVAFFIMAYFSYDRGENFFRSHAKLTYLFCAAWGVSILSGILFFIDLYLL